LGEDPLATPMSTDIPRIQKLQMYHLLHLLFDKENISSAIHVMLLSIYIVHILHAYNYLLCSPYIIGVMNQSGGSTTDLQLHHNFRWVLCASHMEPVQGFLLRYLRRRLLDAEVRGNAQLTEMNDIVQWLPQVWQLINRLLETHGGSDVTIG